MRKTIPSFPMLPFYDSFNHLRRRSLRPSTPPFSIITLFSFWLSFHIYTLPSSSSTISSSIFPTLVATQFRGSQLFQSNSITRILIVGACKWAPRAAVAVAVFLQGFDSIRPMKSSFITTWRRRCRFKSSTWRSSVRSTWTRSNLGTCKVINYKLLH